MLKRLDLWLFADFTLIGLAAIAGATVLHVPGQYPTIQTGLNAASYGDTVLVAPGTYHEHWIMMTNGVTLASSHGMDSTIIDADSLGPVIVCDGVDDQTVISGFTIQHGYYPCGAGIICYAASPVVENNYIRNNEAYVSGGGGIRSEWGSSPIIRRNRIEGNKTPGMGAGIHCYCADGTRVEQNSILNNVAAAYGGGISAEFCSVSITENVIGDNVVLHYTSGGIDLWHSDAFISANVISGNEAESGGGIHAWETLGTIITRNVICENSADRGAGITCFEEASPLISNNTIHANIATSSGGAGIRCVDRSSPTIIHNIVSMAVDGGGICVADTTCLPLILYNDVWNNTGGDYLGCQPGIGDISEEPAFVYMGRHDFRLLWESPCIDAGHPDSLDPDETRRDLGRHFFDQSTPLTIYLTVDESIVSPSDSLRVLYTVINTSQQQASLGGLTNLFLPNGTPYSGNPIVGPRIITLAPNQVRRRLFTHLVPEGAPFGDYEYWSYVGFPPDTVVDCDRIDFCVAPD